MKYFSRRPEDQKSKRLMCTFYLRDGKNSLKILNTETATFTVYSVPGIAVRIKRVQKIDKWEF